MGMTWATPGSESRRFRMIQSAASRTSSGPWTSLLTLRNRISPMIDEMGASAGGPRSGGIWAATSCSFSLTIWRAT